MSPEASSKGSARPRIRIHSDTGEVLLEKSGRGTKDGAGLTHEPLLSELYDWAQITSRDLHRRGRSPRGLMAAGAIGHRA
jgi:hypothetical protein